MAEKHKRKFDYSKYAPLIALVILFIISSVSSPYFLHTRNILNILRQISYTGYIALGMTFVIISGGIDLSVGSMVALAGGIGVLTLNAAGGGVWAIVLAILVTLAIGAGFGALNGVVITKGKIAPFIATL